jgi:hypothetical protein
MGDGMAKITIDIPDNFCGRLARWASVSRTFGNIISSLDNLLMVVDEDKLTQNDLDHAHIALEEAKLLHKPLSDLHMLTRNELWKLEQQNGKSFEGR